MKQLLEEAKRAIRINSASANGNEELASYLTGLLQERGFKPNLQQVTHSFEDVSKRQFNVIGVMGDPLVDKKTRKGLLLGAHLDTPPPGLSQSWTETGGDPLAVTFKEGRIYGLGATSGKLDFLAMLLAAEKFREKKLKMPIYLVGTCGGEMGMFGARYLIKSLALNPKWTLFAEPSDLHLVQAHKHMQIFKVSIDYQMVERDARGFNRRIDLTSLGRSAHGSSPSLGVNAVQQLFEFIDRAMASGFEIRFTRIGGGDAKNKVPDRARGEFYLTSHQFEDFKRFFKEVLRATELEQAFQAELGGLGETGVRFLPDALYPCVVEVIRTFRDLNVEFEKSPNESFDPPQSTAGLTRICQRPTGMDLYFDVRLLPETSAQEIDKKIADSVQAVAAKYPSLNLGTLRERSNPALDANMDSEFAAHCLTALEAAGLPLDPKKKSSSTEAAQFAEAGFESFVFGAGPIIGVSHGPNEYIVADQLDKSVEFYRMLIERCCL